MSIRNMQTIPAQADYRQTPEFAKQNEASTAHNHV